MKSDEYKWRERFSERKKEKKWVNMRMGIIKGMSNNGWCVCDEDEGKVCDGKVEW